MEGVISVEKIFENLTSVLPPLHTVLWGLFALILFYTALHAIIFVYHWHKYNIAPGPFLSLTYIMYFSGIAAFLLVMLLSLLAILS